MGVYICVTFPFKPTFYDRNVKVCITIHPLQGTIIKLAKSRLHVQLCVRVMNFV